jgi:hypothetical protein
MHLIGSFRIISRELGTDPTFSWWIFSLTNHIAKICFSLRFAQTNSPSGKWALGMRLFGHENTTRFFGREEGSAVFVICYIIHSMSAPQGNNFVYPTAAYPVACVPVHYTVCGLEHRLHILLFILSFIFFILTQTWKIIVYKLVPTFCLFMYVAGRGG